jgi:hypothetical protein
MQSYRLRKLLIIAVALSGAVINLVYAIDILRSIMSVRYDNPTTEMMISAAVMEIGWIALLVWMTLKPFERRHILLVTIVPILLGNILHGLNQVWTHSVSLQAFALNTVFGISYSGLYILAFIAGNEGKKHKRESIKPGIYQ